MNLEKLQVIDSINVTLNGILEIRQTTKIIENGNELSKSYFRYCLSPGDSLEGQEPKVVAIANATWTPEVISAFKAQLEAEKANEKLIASESLKTIGA